MNKRTLITVILVLVIVAGVLGAYLGTIEKRPDPDEFEERDLRDVARRDWKALRIVSAAVSMINITLASILIVLYVQTYRKVRSDFTLGLIIVMFALLMYSITSNPSLHLLLGFWAMGLGPFVIISDIFAMAAMSILLYLSLK